MARTEIKRVCSLVFDSLLSCTKWRLSLEVFTRPKIQTGYGLFAIIRGGPYSRLGLMTL